MKGQRHRFSREESAWISTQLQELPRDTVRSTDRWQSLYAAFLARFPDTQGTTLHHYKAHVKYLDNRGPPTQLTRVQQHLRGYEERSKERKRQRRRRRLEAQGRGEESYVKEEDTVDHAEEVDDEPEEEETVDLEDVDTSMEMRIKTETVETTGPRATPRSLLRTKASADALTRVPVAGSKKRKFGVLRRTYGMYDSDVEEQDNNSTYVRKFGIRRDGGAITANPLPATTVVSSTVRTMAPTTPSAEASSTVKRQCVELQPLAVSRALGSSSESATAIKLKMVELQLRDAEHEAQQWKSKFETTAAQLTSEKSTSKVLQSRLDEALATLRATQKKLERAEAATPTTVTVGNGGGSGSGAGGQPPMSFTIRVNVDVSQNGERLQTSSQTLSVDVGSRSGSESPVFC